MQAQNNTVRQNINYWLDGNGAEIMKGITQSQNTYDTIKVIDGSKTEAELYKKLGIPDEYKNVVRAEIYKLMEGKFADNRKVEEAINTTTFADTTLIPNFTNIDSANYFDRTPEQKLAYWNQVNQIKPTGLTPEQWVGMEGKDLETFNKTAKDYIFKAPGEYPLGLSKVDHDKGEDVLDNMKKIETIDPR